MQLGNEGKRIRRAIATTCAAWNTATSGIAKISPLNNVAKITRPLFVVQGKNDPRVPMTEAEQMVKALRERGGSLLVPDGHRRRPRLRQEEERRFSVLAQILFLREHLLK